MTQQALERFATLEADGLLRSIEADGSTDSAEEAFAFALETFEGEVGSIELYLGPQQVDGFKGLRKNARGLIRTLICKDDDARLAIKGVGAGAPSALIPLILPLLKATALAALGPVALLALLTIAASMAAVIATEGLESICKSD